MTHMMREIMLIKESVRLRIKCSGSHPGFFVWKMATPYSFSYLLLLPLKIAARNSLVRKDWFGRVFPYMSWDIGIISPTFCQRQMKIFLIRPQGLVLFFSENLSFFQTTPVWTFLDKIFFSVGKFDKSTNKVALGKGILTSKIYTT